MVVEAFDERFLHNMCDGTLPRRNDAGLPVVAALNSRAGDRPSELGSPRSPQPGSRGVDRRALPGFFADGDQRRWRVILVVRERGGL